MNLKTTVALLVAAVAAGVLVWQASTLAPKVGLAPKPIPPAKGKSAAVLDQLAPNDIRSITVTKPGAAPVVLAVDAPGKPLELPGNWPSRRNEVEELVAVLTALKSRYQTLTLPVVEGKPLLTQFGLDPSQEPVVVDVVTTAGPHTLTFGEGTLADGANPFTRSAYVRVDQEDEVLRLGPDVLPTLRRPADTYRKRQVFPDAVRIKVAENARSASESLPQYILSDAVTGISVQGPNGNYTLERVAASPTPQPVGDKAASDAVILADRLADSWRIAAPMADRVAPMKLKGILAAVPELWVETFLFDPDTVTAMSGLLGGVATRMFDENGPLLDAAGLRDPRHRVTLTMKDGTKRTLLVGKAFKVNTRTEAAPPPMVPGAPPQPPRIVEERFHFAKLADNPLVFEVNGEKFADLFFESTPDPLAKVDPPGSAFSQLRDPNPLRFEPDAVSSVTLVRAGQTLELKKTKGDPKAITDTARKDRWDIAGALTGLAETKQVTDLLDPLERLSAKPTDMIDRPALHALTGGVGIADLAAVGLSSDTETRLTVVSDARNGAPPRTLRIGRHDAAGKKLFVMGSNANRIDLVGDDAQALISRHPRAYRALKLFDLGDNRVEAAVVKDAKETYRLLDDQGRFKLTAPVVADADAEKARTLLKDLAGLEATEFVYDPPSAAEATAARALLGVFGDKALSASAAGFGLDNPSARVTLEFAGAKPMAAVTLELGKIREGKPEYFARLAGSPGVFAIKKVVGDALTAGSLGFLPLQLWNGSPTDIGTVSVTRGNDPAYALKQTGGSWAITAPFAVGADAGAVQPLAAALAAIKADRYAAHSAGAKNDYGFESPALKVTFSLTERKVATPGDEPKEETRDRTLVFGKPEGDAKLGRYARLEGADSAVFVVPEATFTDINKSVLDLLSKRLLSVPPDSVTKIDLAGPDGPLSLQKEDAKEAKGRPAWKPIGATFPVDQQTVDGLLRLFANLNALRFADYGDAVDWAKFGLDAAAKPATIALVAGPLPHKLELGKAVDGAPNERYARVDGGKGVAVLPIAVARELSKGKLDLVERTIFAFDPIDLLAIRRTMGKQEFEAVLEGTNWNVTKPVKLAADAPNLEELSERLSKLRADRVVDVDGKDLAKYGLAEPVATVKLELIGKGAKSVEKSLRLGGPADASKPDGDRYAQVEGSATVMVVGAAVARRLLAEPVKFRERNLASFVTADKLVINRGGKNLVFVKAEGNWKMKEPVEAAAEDESLRELHDALARLRAEEIVAEKPADLKPFGLDAGERFTLFNGDKEVLNLVVGTREKSGDAPGFRNYAKLDKGDLVVLLPMDLSAKLVAEYRKRSLWEPLDVAQATVVEVDTPDGPGSFKLVKGPAGWMDPQMAGEAINQATVTDFLDAVAALKAERFVEHAAADGGKIYGLDPPAKVVTVTTMSGQKRVLHLGRVDESKRAYARTAEQKKEVVLLSERDTGRINLERGKFLATPPKVEPKKGEAKKEEPKAEPKKAEPKKDDVKKDEPKKG